MSTVDVTSNEGVTTLTLDRPSQRNAITTAMLLELRAALGAVRDDPAARVVVLTGAGSAFCAGADLKEFEGSTSANAGLARVRLVSEVIAALRNLEQVSVAAVNGPAIGAGWGLALACDLCFAVTGATFSLPEVPKGHRLPAAIVSRLVEVVGPVRGAEIALGGASYPTSAGCAAGWVAQELPDRRALTEHAAGFASGLAGGPRSSVSTIKNVLRRGSSDELTPPPEYAWNEE